jgi:hypothetical protein
MYLSFITILLKVYNYFNYYFIMWLQLIYFQNEIN